MYMKAYEFKPTRKRILQTCYKCWLRRHFRRTRAFEHHLRRMMRIIKSGVHQMTNKSESFAWVASNRGHYHSVQVGTCPTSPLVHLTGLLLSFWSSFLSNTVAFSHHAFLGSGRSFGAFAICSLVRASLTASSLSHLIGISHQYLS
jgi:hypothetical protein